MPTVPTYQSVDPARRVAPAGVPSVRLDPNAPIEAFGGGGQNVQAAGEHVASAALRIGEEEKTKADQVAVLNADMKLSALETRLLWEPNTGAMNQRGQNVLSVPGQIRDAWKKETEPIYEGLTPDQKLSVKKMDVNRFDSMNANVQRHMAGEMKQFEDTVLDSYIKNETEGAVGDHTNADRISLSISRIHAAVWDYAKRNGLPEEWIKLKTSDSESKINAGVIGRYLDNGDDLKASGFRNAKTTYLSGADVGAVEKALQEGSVRGESQRITDKIVGGQSGSAITRQDALAEAKSIKDPKVRDAAETRINQYFSEKKQSELEVQNDLYLKATELIDKNKGPQAARDIVPTTIWSKLSLEHRNALENRAADPENDNKTWLNFLALDTKAVANLSRADFETQYWSKFDKSTRAKAEAQWNAAKEAQANPTKASEFQSMITDKDMVLEAMKTAGAIPEKSTLTDIAKDNDKSKAYATFRANADDAFKSFYHQTGKNPSDEQKQKIVNDLMIRKVFVNDGWFGLTSTEKPVLAVGADDLKKVYKPIGQIPARARMELINAARASGVIAPSVTDERAAVVLQKRIERAYATRIAGGSLEQTISIMAEH